MDKNNSYEIPFGAKDSELKGWEYTIPEGMEAEIKNGKIIVREKENEDERIWKELIGFIQDEIDSINRLVSGDYDDRDADDIAHQKWCEKVLAWLEKQGEHIKFLKSIQIGDKVTRNPDGVLVNLSQFKRKAEQGSQNLANSAKTCMVEQQPAERNVDNRKLCDIVIEELSKYNGNEVCKAPWAVDSTGVQFPLYFTELGMKWQKKQNHAWSEEDEKMLNKCIEYASNIIPVKPTKERGLFVDFKRIPDKKAQDWLKSLKERYTWKPSDEQIIALKKACDEHWEPDGLDPLYMLYQGLKKLKL